MLLLAYSFDDRPRLDSQSAALVLCVTTAMCVIGATCTLTMMQERFRSTFYKHCTMAKHVRDFWWYHGSASYIEQKLMKDCDHDLIRGHQVVRTFATAYLPMDLVEEWVRENWYVG